MYGTLHRGVYKVLKYHALVTCFPKLQEVQLVTKLSLFPLEKFRKGLLKKACLRGIISISAK